MEIIDVVNKLIGPIMPVADSAIDDKRFDNLKEYCLLADRMLFQINQVAKHMNSDFASVKHAAKYAEKFLMEVKQQ